MGVADLLHEVSSITASSVAVAAAALFGLSASVQAAECPPGFVSNDGSFPPVGENGFVEIGDAGQLLPDAQVIAQCPVTLDFISGEFSSNTDIDLFKISLTGTTPFSARIYSFSPGYALSTDTQLFLFDSNGIGVVANDDTSLTPGAVYPTKTFEEVSAISTIGATALPAGDYFLGISWFDNDPLSDEGLIFPNEPFQAVVGSTGPGGELPLSSWTANNTGGFGSYLIQLSGVQPVAAATTAVPEPSSALGVLVLGALGAGTVLRRKQHSTGRV